MHNYCNDVLARGFQLFDIIKLRPVIIMISLLLVGCSQKNTTPEPIKPSNEGWATTDPPIPVTMQHVVRTIARDPTSLTQGFYYKNGGFIESSGGYGRSSIKRIDAETGEIKIIRELPKKFYGEGCAPTPSGIVQLTWHNRIALRYDENTLVLKEYRTYPREGWGLLYDGTNLIASDGSDRLYALDHETLELLRVITVRTVDDHPMHRLNEMAWVKDMALANVFMTDLIVAIDIATGVIKKCWDLSAITMHENPTNAEHVLNGIAYDPETDRMWITGKGWSNIYEIKLPYIKHGESAGKMAY